MIDPQDIIKEIKKALSHFKIIDFSENSQEPGMIDPQDIIKEIRKAFPAIVIPFDGIIAQPRPVDKEISWRCQNLAGKEKIRKRMAGKTWKELDFNFAQEFWSYNSYLSALGWIHFAPAILSSTLGTKAEEENFRSKAINILEPSWHDLYFYGIDPLFEEQKHLLNQKQKHAICTFLQFCLEQSGSFYEKILVAQVIRKGWSENLDHAAVIAANELFERLENYRWKTAKDPDRAGVIAKIREGFLHTPYPGHNALCDSHQGDEPAEQALALQGLKWDLIHPQLLAVYRTAQSFLTGPGLRYFLPAFLIAEVMDSEQTEKEETFGEDSIFTLTGGFLNPEDRLHSHYISMFSFYTKPEREAVLAYLNYKKDLPEEEFQKQDIETAISTFWGKP